MPDLLTALQTAMPFDRFRTPELLAWILGNVLFLTIWAVVFYRKAWLTLEIYFFAQQLWFPLFFMLPFAHSDYNWVSLGKYWWQTRPFITEAFYHVVIGVIFTAIGWGLSRKFTLTLPGLGFVYRSVNGAWITSAGMGVAIVTVTAFLGLFVAMGMQPFNARADAILDRSILPLYNFFQIFTQFMTLCAMAYFYATRKWIGLAAILLLAFGGLFTGARGPFLFFAFQFLVLYAIVAQVRRIGKPLILGTVFLLFSMYMSGWRYGDFGLQRVLSTPFLLVYGSNFSDLRDYAMTLSGWNEQLVMGQTFLAGFLTGLPGFGAFRDLYAWGNWVQITAIGYVMSGHPGFRPILFGEWFFNFGYPGLIICAIAYGFIVGRLSDFVRAGIATGEKRAAITAAVSAFAYWMMISNFLQTAAFFTFHVLLVLTFLGYCASLATRREMALAA